MRFFADFLTQGESVVEVAPQLFKIVNDSEAKPQASKWVSFGSGIGYGGALSVATVFLPDDKLHTIALLSSKETAPYFAKVSEEKLPNALLGQSAKQAFSHDGVTGATLTSQAYISAVDSAADLLRQHKFGYSLFEPTSPWQQLQWLDAAAVVFFIAAVALNRSRSKHKAKLNAGLLLGSTLVFGFYSASLYSVSTIGGMIGGAWLMGVANYTPFILLGLSIVYIGYYNRNIYCQSLCPFGAVQQCLAKVGNAKSSPIRQPFFIWFPRLLLLVTLCMGAYFRSPAAFIYEPFGIAFGMIGGIYLFVLTIVIVLTSLVVRRPWCQSLCPINAMTDFIVFNKNWLKQIRSQRSKKRPHIQKAKEA